MYRESFLDHLAAQGCNWSFNTPTAAVYHSNGKGCFIDNDGEWVSPMQVRVICAALDIEIPPELKDDGDDFNYYEYVSR